MAKTLTKRGWVSSRQAEISAMVSKCDSLRSARLTLRRGRQMRLTEECTAVPSSLCGATGEDRVEQTERATND